MLALLILVMVGLELPHRVMPQLPPGKHERIYVLGDSLSQGIIKGVSWPGSLAARHGVTVINLARNGATTADAREEAAGIPEDAGLVIIEIGGNDLLGGTPVGQFLKDLDVLLYTVCRRGRVVVLLELPLPPTYEQWGRVQRGLARKHGVLLVPKSYFAGVLGTRDATADGLHLSASGADAMADMVYGVLGGILNGH